LTPGILTHDIGLKPGSRPDEFGTVEDGYYVA
jgi:hypothetical protein